MKTLCYSVRLESLVRISDRAYKATAFDGTSDIIPASQVYGMDLEVTNSEAYWISAWILEKKSIQYSHKKARWFGENGEMLPTYEHHTPDRVKAVASNEVNDLRR